MLRTRPKASSSYKLLYLDQIGSSVAPSALLPSGEDPLVLLDVEAEPSHDSQLLVAPAG